MGRRRRQDLVLKCSAKLTSSEFVSEKATTRTRYQFRVHDRSWVGDKNYAGMAREQDSQGLCEYDEALAELFRQSGFDLSEYLGPFHQCMSANYLPGENKLVLGTRYMGSGWRGSPTEFFMDDVDLEEHEINFTFPDDAWVSFAQRMGGFTFGYDEETPAKIFMVGRE